jgi:hypothetical protein
MKLYLSTSCYTTNTREPYSDDSWDRGDTERSWHFGGISLEKPVGEYEYIEVDDDFDTTGNIYLVLAVWSTGDSFGNDGGACCEIFAAYNIREDAEEAERLLLRASAGNDMFKGLELPDGFKLSYIPWMGYFKSLDYITIVEGSIE